MRTGSVAALVARAGLGDEHAWSELVDRYAGLVWSITAAHRLRRADAADVSQVTWLRLVEHLDRLKEPEAVAGWLATTARNECLAVIRRSGRQIPVEPEHVPDDGRFVDLASLDEGLLDDELAAAVRLALGTLPEHCQVLLRLLVTEPPLSYDEISAAIGRPVGSIGPTRARCLERLRRHPDVARMEGES